MIFFVVGIIVVISVALAFLSLINQQKMHEVRDVKRKLQRGKVIFQKDSSSSRG